LTLAAGRVAGFAFRSNLVRSVWAVSETLVEVEKKRWFAGEAIVGKSQASLTVGCTDIAPLRYNYYEFLLLALGTVVSSGHLLMH
jgi:hypothetical protein